MVKVPEQQPRQGGFKPERLELVVVQVESSNAGGARPLNGPLHSSQGCSMPW